MSHATLYEFRDGLPKAAAEYKNAWGSAAFVWNALHSRYLKSPEYETWMLPTGRDAQNAALWGLPRAAELPLQLFERAVMASTYDRAIVVRRNFAEYVAHLEMFVHQYRKGGDVCHLQSWADFISISVADAIGFSQTSCGDDPWFAIGEDGELLPYNIHNGKEHFEVYEWLRVNGIR